MESERAPQCTGNSEISKARRKKAPVLVRKRAFLASPLRGLFQFDLWRVLVEHADVLCPSEFLEYSDRDPVLIELVPPRAVSGRGRVGVVVVVPAFAKGEDGNEPVV